VYVTNAFSSLLPVSGRSNLFENVASVEADAHVYTLLYHWLEVSLYQWVDFVSPRRACVSRCRVARDAIQAPKSGNVLQINVHLYRLH
jgi:hypothetical protein